MAALVKVRGYWDAPTQFIQFLPLLPQASMPHDRCICTGDGIGLGFLTLDLMAFEFDPVT